MKKFFLLLLAVAVVGVVLNPKTSPPSQAQKSSQSSSLTSAPAPITSQGPAPVAPKTASVTPDERVKLIAEYRKALLSLSEKVRELGLDDRALVDELLAELPKANYSKLPKELAPALKSFHAAIGKLQDFDLKADHRSRQDIAPLKVYRPQWVEDREAELRQQKLPAALATELATLAMAPRLNDGDIARVVDLCARARDCVEHSVMQLIDANHLLTDEQLAFIKSRVN